MATKYEPLTDFLSRQRSDRFEVSFDVISGLVGGLPKSAVEHRAWWQNDSGGTHVQASGWMNAGWAVDSVDRESRSVVFRRVRQPTV